LPLVVLFIADDALFIPSFVYVLVADFLKNFVKKTIFLHNLFKQLAIFFVSMKLAAIAGIVGLMLGMYVQSANAQLSRTVLEQMNADARITGQERAIAVLPEKNLVMDIGETTVVDEYLLSEGYSQYITMDFSYIDTHLDVASIFLYHTHTRLTESMMRFELQQIFQTEKQNFANQIGRRLSVAEWDFFLKQFIEQNMGAIQIHHEIISYAPSPADVTAAAMADAYVLSHNLPCDPNLHFGIIQESTFGRSPIVIMYELRDEVKKNIKGMMETNIADEVIDAYAQDVGAIYNRELETFFSTMPEYTAAAEARVAFRQYVNNNSTVLLLEEIIVK